MSLALFAVRLKDLRTNAKLKAEDFVQFGISGRMIFKYERAEQSPTLEKLVALANVFGVSLDYLCGRTDDPQREQFKELNNHCTPAPFSNLNVAQKNSLKVL
jgi:transcriptional regulator with XRE-family HTH domain